MNGDNYFFTELKIKVNRININRIIQICLTGRSSCTSALSYPSELEHGGSSMTELKASCVGGWNVPARGARNYTGRSPLQLCVTSLRPVQFRPTPQLNL